MDEKWEVFCYEENEDEDNGKSPLRCYDEREKGSKKKEKMASASQKTGRRKK